MDLPADGSPTGQRLQPASVGEVRRARRRRPTGAAPPLPYRLQTSAVGWLVAAVVLVGLTLAVFGRGMRGSAIAVTVVDDAVVRWLGGLHAPGLQALWQGLAHLGSWWALIILQFGLLLALLVLRRWRHLIVWLVVWNVVMILVGLLDAVARRPRPFGVEQRVGWGGWAMPSMELTHLTLICVGVLYTLVPEGRWRNLGKWVAAGLVTVVAVGRIALGAEAPTDVLLTVGIAVSIPLLAFRRFTPSEVFPISYRRGRAAHLDVGGARGTAIRRPLEEQLGLVVEDITPFGLAGSAGSTPLRITIKGNPPSWLFGKLYAQSHLRADRWYKLGRELLYGRLEDEKPFNTVRRLVQQEDYALRLMRDHRLPTPTPYGFVELTPERKYLLVTEFFADATELGEAEISDDTIDDGLGIVRKLWEAGLAHRDIKPANLLVRDGRLLIDVAFVEARPSPWRQAVDLANMMLCLALRSSPEQVYRRALHHFSVEEIGEGFAAARGLALPSQLRRMLRAQGRDLHGEFVRLLPTPPQPIRVQRWSARRLGLWAVIVAVLVLLALNPTFIFDNRTTSSPVAACPTGCSPPATPRGHSPQNYPDCSDSPAATPCARRSASGRMDACVWMPWPVITARPTVEAVGRAWALSLTCTIWLAVVAWSMRGSDACRLADDGVGSAATSPTITASRPLAAASARRKCRRCQHVCRPSRLDRLASGQQAPRGRTPVRPVGLGRAHRYAPEPGGGPCVTENLTAMRHDESAGTPVTRPVLFVVDADPKARARTESTLARRFGSDYSVLSAASVSAGLATLERLARAGTPVALVAADLHLPGIGGVDFLQRAHHLHRHTSRVLLVTMDRHGTRIPFTELATLQRATALALIDMVVVKGWVSPEEWLYPQVQEALTTWTLAHRPRHVVYRIVGDQWAPRSHLLRDLLSRNGVPFEFAAADSDRGRQLLRDFRIDAARLPAVIHSSGRVLYDPAPADLATSHGIATRPSQPLYDLAVLGAGPAGLAAAVYAASEGLRTLVIEPKAIGGQAGTSSMIRNYLGFTRGVTGAELAHRGWEQAILLGAEVIFPQPASRLAVRGADRLITFLDQTEVVARAVLVAVGVTYRRLPIPALDRLVGSGVFYGAASAEAPALAGEQVYVVGGANSAGQAALHLARFAARVTLLIRGASLTAGMSAYLVTQIEATPTIDVRLHTRVLDGRGESRLGALTLEDTQTGRRDEVSAAAVFILIGAEPHTDWLRDTVCLDDRGFVLTGTDVPAKAWPATRAPLPFESSVPGVLAAGDVRHGSVKRVAGAVGEGSVAVGSVHRYLAEFAASIPTGR